MLTLEPGVRLGSYQVVSSLGAGGMGEVYRATDTKLGRDVALKILPATFTNDPERLARFRREAQVLAALNHPHIGAIYGLDEAHGQQFLVLELIDGATLADRIASGPLSVDEALAIAKQIAEALEAAHEKGIVHRDLKPANIGLTQGGTVKVLDFGLAKATDPISATSLDLSNSPTISSPAMMTSVGVILGTAAYMSPEQAKGRPADKRSDVWAFGCVLYEMLTGKPAFDGDDVSEVLAAILRGEPDWNAYPRDVPHHVRAVVKRCVTKDRSARIRDCAVVRFLLDEQATAEPVAKKSWKWALAGVAIVLAVAASATVAVVWQMSGRAPIGTARFFIYAPPKSEFVTGGRLGLTSAAVSPDGKTIAFTARDAASNVSLWIRDVNAFHAQPMPGTEGAAYPVWSPDSRFILYSTQGKLMKVARNGGPSQMICNIPSMGTGRGAAWGRGGTIVLNGGPGRLFRVPATGGEPTLFLEISGDHADYGFPSFLPDGDHVLFYVTAAVPSHAGVYVASLEKRHLNRIVSAESGAVYDSTNQLLLFVRQGSLVAQPFDLNTRTVQGDAVPIAENVESRGFTGLRAFSVSDTGVLVYGTAGNGGDSGNVLTWLDRTGKVVGTVGPQLAYRGIALSPDGEQLAFHRHEGDRGDIWITQLSTGKTTRLTFDPTLDNSSPVWSPDGKRIAFTSFERGRWMLRVKPTNNTQGEQTWLALEGASTLSVTAWAPDGSAVVYNRRGEKSGLDIWNLRLSSASTTDPLVVTPAPEYDGQVSPDGKWLAYASLEGGKLEVYVQPYPTGAGKWQVSTHGGVQPIWRRDGRELFFLGTSAGADVTAAPVTPNGTGLQIGTPVSLFRSGFTSEPHSSRYLSYAVSADGQRFLIPRPPARAEQPDSLPIAVVVNWADALKSSGVTK